MNAQTDPLVEDYLARLEAAAAGLPVERRNELVSEIRDHLQEGLRLSASRDEVAVRNLIERLGSPEEIVLAATDTPTSAVAPSVPINSSAIISVLLGVLWLFGIGSVLALIFGYRARRQIAGSAVDQKGSGLAVAGIVLGWVGIAILALVIIGGFGLMAASAPGGPARVSGY